MFNRMRFVAATAALVATAPLATVGTANAALAAGEAKPERTITIKGVEPRDGVFFVKGKVEPTYQERFAVLQRKLKSEKSWDNFGTFNDHRRQHLPRAHLRPQATGRRLLPGQDQGQRQLQDVLLRPSVHPHVPLLIPTRDPGA